MKKRNILIIISLILIIVPFFINVYSIYRLILVALGILVLDISLALNSKKSIFMLIYMPVVLLTLTYGIDYLTVYTISKKPIYVFESKINDEVSIYNSLFYRIYKCGREEYFDNNYEENFKCDTKLVEEIDVNSILLDTKNGYKKYKHSFIKVTGKVSKIAGTSSIEMRAYSKTDNEFNGYVKFDETSKLVVNLNGIDVSNYKIYDYITVVGLLDSYDKSSNTLTLTDIKLENNYLYDEYEVHVIESASCEKTLKEYVDNYYLYCLENIYIDYDIDQYELSYALKDEKISMNDLLKDSKVETKDDYKIYKYEKFNVLACSEEKNIIYNKNEKINYSLCEE